MCFSTFSQLISLRFTSAACRDAAAEGVGGGDANLSAGLLCRENIWIISCLFVCLFVDYVRADGDVSVFNLSRRLWDLFDLRCQVLVISETSILYHLYRRVALQTKIWHLRESSSVIIGCMLGFRLYIYVVGEVSITSTVAHTDCSNITLHQGVTACWWTTK